MFLVIKSAIIRLMYFYFSYKHITKENYGQQICTLQFH
jgi:hypothetical protein